VDFENRKISKESENQKILNLTNWFINIKLKVA
jgi:hypothetical protein